MGFGGPTGEARQRGLGRHSFSLPSAIVPTMEACASWWWTTSRRSASRWRIVIPASAVAAGIGAALLVGAAAGIYPAVRAARLAPTEVLRSV